MGGGSKLPGAGVQRLQDALLSAFPSRTALAQMVRMGLDENLDAVATQENLRAAVFELIGWAEAQGRLAELIAAARSANPGNPELRVFAESREKQRRGALVYLRVVGTPYAYQAPPGIQVLSVGRQRRKLGSATEDGNDIVVRVAGDDSKTLRISRRHVEIVHAAERWFLVDRSRGYTTLNDAPIPEGEPVPLHSGDRIGLAGVLLVEFSLREASSEAVVAGPIDVGVKTGEARGVVLEASVGDMVTARDDD